MDLKISFFITKLISLMKFYRCHACEMQCSTVAREQRRSFSSRQFIRELCRPKIRI